MKSKINKETVAVAIMVLLCIFALTNCSKLVSLLVRVADKYDIRTDLMGELEIKYHAKVKTSVGASAYFTVVKLKTKPKEFLDYIA